MKSMKDLEVLQELRDKWKKEAPLGHVADYLIAQAAQWAWNQREPEIQAAVDAEREACCEWLRTGPYGASIACHAEQMISDLRAARRPKHPSLKEQALNELSRLMSKQVGMFDGKPFDTIRQALETLPDE